MAFFINILLVYDIRVKDNSWNRKIINKIKTLFDKTYKERFLFYI